VGTRTVFMLCRVTLTPSGYALAPLPGKGSADLHTPCLANAYLRVEPGLPLAEGSPVAFEWIGATSWTNSPT
jgi:hypothetical protein